MNQSHNHSIHTVLFDFDGTLIDQFQPLYRSYAYTLQQVNVPVPSFEEIKKTVGGTMRHTMEIWVGKEKLDEAAVIFRKHFVEHMTDGLKILPGAETLLERLHKKGIQLALHTNKHGPTSRSLCDSLNWTRWFEVVQGSDDTPWRKPDAECTQALMKQLGCNRETTIMVGDSPFDIHTAQNVGMRCYTVATGTHSQEELATDTPDGNFRDLYELAEKVFGLQID